MLPKMTMISPISLNLETVTDAKKQIYYKKLDIAEG